MATKNSSILRVALLLVGLLIFLNNANTLAQTQVDVAKGPLQINSQGFELIQVLGCGTANVVAWSNNGDKLAVGGSTGIILYSADLEILSSIENFYEDVLLLEWHPNDMLLAIVVKTGLYSANNIIIWDIFSGLQQVLTGHTGSVNTLSWHPDGTLLASGARDYDIRVWNTTDWTSQVVGSQSASIRDIAWNPTSAGSLQLVSGSEDGSARIWDVMSRQELSRFDLYDTVTGVAWSPDGTKIATTGDFQAIHLWDVTTQEIAISLHYEATVTYEPILDLIWVGSNLLAIGNTVYVWDTQTMQQQYSIKKSAQSVAVNATTGKFAIISYDKIFTYNLETGNLDLVLFDHSEHGYNLTWFSETALMSGSSNLWDIETNQLLTHIPVPIHSWSNNRSWAYALVGGALDFTVFDGQLALLTMTGQVAPYEPSIPPLVTATLEQPHEVYDMSWSPSDSQIATIERNSNQVRIYETNTWALSVVLSNETLDYPEAIDWSSSGHRLAVGGLTSNLESLVLVWNTTTVSLEQIFQQPSGGVMSLAWNPTTDAKLAIGIFDSPLHIWDLSDGTALTLGDTHHVSLISWHPSGSFIAFTSGYIVEIWDVDNEVYLGELQPNSAYINAISWNPDGTRIAIGSANDTISIFEIHSNDCIHDTLTFTNEITAANASGIADTICLSPNTTQTFATPDNGLNALPIITGDITIEGNGATLTRDDTADLFRFFEVAPGGSLTLNNLTLNNGKVDDAGGAILNHGTLVIHGSTLTDNYAHHSGGAIYNTGSLTIVNSSFNENRTYRYAGVGTPPLVEGYGGALENAAGATATISECDFIANGADYGGAIANAGTLTLADSTFTYNLVSTNDSVTTPEPWNGFSNRNWTMGGGSVGISNADGKPGNQRHTIMNGFICNIMYGAC